MSRHLFSLFIILISVGIALPIAHAQDAAYVLPADLYYLGHDAQGITQLWRLTPASAQPQALTAESVDVTNYALSPDGDRFAYVAGGNLFVGDLVGTDRHHVAQLVTQQAPDPLHMEWKPVGTSIGWSPENTWLTYHDELGIWIVPADGSQPPRQIVTHHIPQTIEDVSNVRFYSEPRWSPDGTQLLVTVNLWEGVVYETVTIATGSSTELHQLNSSYAAWTLDNRVIAWSDIYGYQQPGLYLADPTNATAAPMELVPPDTLVKCALQTPDGAIFIVRGTATDVDAPYDVVESTPALGAPFTQVPNTTGGYVIQPRLLPDTTPPLIAGLLDTTYFEYEKGGDLVLLDLGTGAVTPIATGGPVWDVQWGTYLQG